MGSREGAKTQRRGAVDRQSAAPIVKPSHLAANRNYDCCVGSKMTSRETTSALARRWDASVEREAADWARLIGFGVIQWPWLLKSLYGGRKRDKAALLARLGLAPDALPNLGSWKADTGLLTLIVDLIFEHRPKTVVELGAGASTLIAARAIGREGYGGRLVSYDQHADFVAATSAWLLDNEAVAEIRHAPIASPTGRWADLWYDLGGVPDTIDLLLIDGPPWAIDAQVRGKAQCLFDRMAPGGIAVLDDAARPGERLVIKQWKRDWPMVEWHYVAGIKGTLIGRWP